MTTDEDERERRDERDKDQKTEKIKENLSLAERVASAWKNNDDDDFVKAFLKVFLAKTMQEMVSPTPHSQPVYYPPPNPPKEEGMSMKDAMTLFLQITAKENERMDKLVEKITENNNKMMETFFALKTKEMETKQEQEVGGKIEELKAYYEEKINSLTREYEDLKGKLSPEQSEQVKRSISVLEELQEAMEAYKKTGELFREIGQIVGNPEAKEKQFNVKDIANTIKEVAEPLIESTQTILGIAQQTPVQPPPEKPFTPAQAPAPKKGDGGNNPPAQLPPPPITRKQEPKQEPLEEPVQQAEPIKDWADIPIEKVELDNKDAKEISKIIGTKKMIINGKEDTAVYLAKIGENAIMTDGEGKAMTKDQFDYLYITSPEFRQMITKQKGA